MITTASVCGLSRAVEKRYSNSSRSIEARQTSTHTHEHWHFGLSYQSQNLIPPREDILKRAVQAVKWAKSYVDDVEFYAEDAGHTDNDYLARVIEAVIAAGAPSGEYSGYNRLLPPHQYGEKIAFLVNNVPNIDKAIISCHCHNDLGLATANSIAGVIAGARQIECTINGLGERASDTSLEEVVMIIKQHKHLGFYTNIEKQNN